jgi:hypothetical protein
MGEIRDFGKRAQSDGEWVTIFDVKGSPEAVVLATGAYEERLNWAAKQPNISRIRSNNETMTEDSHIFGPREILTRLLIEVQYQA